MGLGSLAMDILEHLAVREYGAKWIALDTWAHGRRYTETGELVEQFEEVGRSIAWYQRRGYQIYRVSVTSFEET